MNITQLMDAVYDANLELVRQGLVIYTWGNVSAIDREKGLVIIKPSGVSYESMKASDMVTLSLESGEVVAGHLRPSSDTDTHLVLYRKYQEIGSVVHTHSTWATVWAQAQQSIPCYGTTHADYFYGDIPCTPPMTAEEIGGRYEHETGNVICRTLGDDIYGACGVLVAGHGPFTWGKDTHEAVHNAVVLEQIAHMAYATRTLGRTQSISQELMDKHYFRKHGPGAYYGQK